MLYNIHHLRSRELYLAIKGQGIRHSFPRLSGKIASNIDI